MLTLSRICLTCRLRMAWQPSMLLNARSQVRSFRPRREDPRTVTNNALDKKYDELVFDAFDQHRNYDQRNYEPHEHRNYDRQRDHSASTIEFTSPIDDQTTLKWTQFHSKYDYPTATHNINDLDESLVGQRVILHGFYTLPRKTKYTSFFSIIDFAKGRNSVFFNDYPLQVVSYINPDSSLETINSHEMLSSLRPFTPVAVEGVVVLGGGPQHRITPPGREQEDTFDPRRQERTLQKVELRMDKIYKMNDISEDVMITRDSVFSLKDRHLQLRLDPKLRKAIRTRAKTASLCRNLLESQGFLEVETPLLFKSTPEGAREFLVPTRKEGVMYALPQSPQQYKQILMASGVYRYYQLAKCFRDEDLRADRQPEFTQLDMELAFAKSADVINIVSDLVTEIWRSIYDKVIPKIWTLPYDLVIRRYGSDKPDLRYNHSRIRDVSAIVPYLRGNDKDIVEAFVLETYNDEELYNADIGRNLHDNVLSQLDLKEQEVDNPLISFAGDSIRNAHYFKNSGDVDYLRRFLSARPDQIMVVQARKKRAFGGSTQLGVVRDALLKEAFSQGLVHRVSRDLFVWITDFPLFKHATDAEPGQEGASGLSSNHHPFTAPKLEDLHLLQKDPLSVRAEHYDLVVNGVELGGGSARIHDPELQKYILEEVLKVPENKLRQFDHLIKVLGSGCPPHAGIALGFDRLIAVLVGADTVRDVIAFPKNGKGQDLLVNSPAIVDQKNLEPYFLRMVGKRQN